MTDNRPVIRPATPADATAIAAVRRASWRAAYAGIIRQPFLDNATAGGGQAASPPPYRRTFVAVTAARTQEGPAGAAGAGGGQPQDVIGYASFGPERGVATLIPTPARSDGPARGRGGGADLTPFASELTPAGLAGEAGELYAIYLDPRWWSAGVGRALTETVLAALREAGYRRVVLWTLTGNARARGFYERAGFAPDGATNVLVGLGGVEELRYARDLFS